MARQRLVKPDVFQHEELYRAEANAGLPLRLAFIGLWTQCDRRGCFEWKPTRLKLHVLPFDHDVDFNAVLSALEAGGFVRSYVVGGKRFGQVPTLPLHQSFNINERPNPLIPNPPDDASTVQPPSLYGASTPSTAVSTGSGSSAGSSTAAVGTTADVDAFKRELTTAANKAIARKFGEQTEPILASNGKSHQLAEVVLNRGIPFDFAARSIVRQVEKLDKPVRVMTYFRPGIFDDWDKHNEKAAASKPQITRPASAPVKSEDDGVMCFVCRTKETELQGRRYVPKHTPDCPAAKIGNGGAAA